MALTEQDVRDLVRDELSRPASLPAEFRSWVPRWVEATGVELPRSNITGLYTTATSVANLGEIFDGRPGVIRAGSSYDWDFVQLQGDTTANKWVSTQTHAGGQTATATVANSDVWDYCDYCVPVFIPGHYNLYNAGLRLEVTFLTYLDLVLNAGSGSAHLEARAALEELKPNGISTIIAHSDPLEVLTATASGSTTVTQADWYQIRWSQFTYDTTPADSPVRLVIQNRRVIDSGTPSINTRTMSESIYAVRWVSA